MFGAGFNPTFFELTKACLVLFITGGVIKLLDDFLDLRYDVYTGAPSLAVKLGEGSLPYGLIGFTIAVMIDHRLAAALFVGAYTVGMIGDFKRKLPSGWPGYGECIVVLAVAASFIHWHIVLWAVFVMLAIQIADDIVDASADRWSGNPNLVHLLGIVESRILGVIALCIASFAHPVYTALSFMLLPLILTAYKRASMRKRSAGKDNYYGDF